MPIEVGLSNAAKTDLADIWEFTFHRWGLARADQYNDEILTRLESLSTNARKGRECPDLHPGARRLTCGRHIAFYVIRDTHIEVLRILHQAMDLSAHLDET